MDMDDIFRYPGFKIKKHSFQGDTQLRIFLNREDDDSPRCYKCGHEMTEIRGHQKCHADDLTVMERKVRVAFRRLKGKCNQCKKVRLEYIDWLAPCNSQMTLRLSVFLFKLCEIATISRVAKVTNRGASSMWRNDLKVLMMQLSKYKIPNVTKICVDEVYARAWHDEDEGENRSDRFFTVISDAATRKVIWVEDSRRQAALDNFFQKLGPERCARITVAATDQHDEYKNSIKTHCPQAIHVYDRFHLVKKCEEAINKTRIRLYKMLPQNEVKKLAMGRFKYIFLKRASKRTSEEQSHMDRLLKDNLAFINLEMIKERWLTFFEANDATEALSIFNELGVMIADAGFPEMKKWWKKTEKEWATIINYFKHRITTALSEGINNVIKALKRRAFGYRNMDYFKLKIMQQCGFLNSELLSLNGQWTPKALHLFEISNA